MMNQILSAARISKENHRKLNSEKEKNITKNTLYSLAVVLREAKIKVIFSGRTTKRGGGSKTPHPTKQKKYFHIYDLKKNYQNLMKHKKN